MMDPLVLELPRKINEGSRDLTEALGKILIPSDLENNVDEACCGMDADSNTLLANPVHEVNDTQNTSSFATSINNALCGRTYDSGFGDSRYSESPDFQHCAYGKEANEHTVTGLSKKMSSVARSKDRNTVAITGPQDRKWVNDKSARTTSQPLNRIDLAPNSNSNQTGLVQNSPMFTPRARKEVAPEYKRR